MHPVDDRFRSRGQRRRDRIGDSLMFRFAAHLSFDGPLTERVGERARSIGEGAESAGECALVPVTRGAHTVERVASQ